VTAVPTGSDPASRASSVSTVAGTVHISADEARPSAPVHQGRLTRFRAFVTQSRLIVALAFGTIAGVVTAMTAATGLLYDWFPDLRGDPEVQTAAALRIVATEGNATHARFRRLAGLPPDRDQATTGNLFYVELETKGMKRQEGLFTWCLLDVKTGTRIPWYDCESLRPKPGTTNDRFIVPVWFQAPIDPGRYFLRFEYRGKNALLAIADSPPFGPCRQASCGYAGTESQER
jgi:hypothetical protein